MVNKTFANTPGGATISTTNPGYEEGQVGIPGVNVATTNSPANPTGEMGPAINNGNTTNGTTPPSSSTVATDTSNSINTNLGKAIEEGINENKKLEETINTNFEQGQKDIVNDKETDTKVADKFYSENEKLIKEADDELAKIEEEQLKLAEDRKGRDVALLEGKKQSEIDMLEASNALQRAKNEQALKEARYKVEIEKQQSAWAYNKLGLGFSSGIINQSQQIATQGIAKIAEIKAQMSFNEASIDAQIAGLEFDYSSLVNQTIDKYADRTNEIKESMKARINETKKSLLLNSFDKNKELTTIEREARDALKDAERTHIEDIIKVKNKGIEMEQALQTEISRYKNEELKKMDTMLSNGTFAKLTPEQIALKEKELGLPAGSLTMEFNNSIGADIRGTFDSILGADYMVDNMPTLVQDMKNEMKMGRTYEEAFNVILARELKENPTYQAKLKKVSLEERKFQLEQEKEAFDQKLKEAQFGLDEKYKLGSLNLAKSKASAGSGGGVNSSKAIKIAMATTLGLKGDLKNVSEADLDTFIANNQEENKVKPISETTYGYIDAFKDDTNDKSNVNRAYKGLLADGMSKEDAITFLYEEGNSVDGEVKLKPIYEKDENGKNKVKGMKLIESDVINDDTLLKIDF